LAETVQQFHDRYGNFPTSVSIGHRAVDDIRQPLSLSEWEELNRRLPIQVNSSEDWAILVADANGNVLDYAQVRFSDEGYATAEEFLGNLFADAYSIQ
jgi:hypothetical protein